MDKENNTFIMGIIIRATISMGCLRVSVFIDGKTIANMKEILNKAYEMVMEYGYLMMRNRNIEVNTLWIKSVDMESMFGV